MKGWLSQLFTNLFLICRSVTSTIEYNIRFPAVGARNVARSSSSRTSGSITLFSYARMDFRLRMVSITGFISVCLLYYQTCSVAKS